jgi:hypothetical protein
LRAVAVLGTIPICLMLAILPALATPGSELWVKRYNDPANSIDQARALGVSPDGSMVFVTGSVGSATNSDYATVAYDASTGSRRWVQRYNGPPDYADTATALVVSPDGSTVFVTGYSVGSSTSWDYFTVSYDASTGSRLWVKRYNDHKNGIDKARALGVSPDGSMVFVTGNSGAGSPTRRDYATVAYDASTGSRRWVKRYNGPGYGPEHAVALVVSPDGSTVFVTGYSAGSTTNIDYATVAYDASTGSRLWVKRYNGHKNGIDKARALGVSPDGSTVFVTGSSLSSTTSIDYATVAYDASTGSRQWVKRYNGPANGDDGATALGVNPDGSTVFVTGSSLSSTTSIDYATVAYDASTGSRRWVKRYNGPANGDDGATALGVNPDGSTVFVTGSSLSSTTSIDYATVAYGIT